MKMKRNIATRNIFIIYCLILIWIVLFKTAFSFEEIHWFERTRSVNLIPFYYGTDMERFQMREVLLNVLVFVPWGVYLKMLDVSSRKTLIYGCGCSIVLELCQFVLAIGASDITDIITNTFGTIVGIYVYLIARKIISNKETLDRIINGMATIALSLFGMLAVLLFIAN